MQYYIRDLYVVHHIKNCDICMKRLNGIKYVLYFRVEAVKKTTRDLVIISIDGK
jgi:hypothetical protein